MNSDSYRTRICPECGGTIECGIKAGEEEYDGSFGIRFTMLCTECGFNVSSSNSWIFDAVESIGSEKEISATKMVENAYVDEVDGKWVYQTSTYRGL